VSTACAGHSLGGALAQLAAIDIARGAQQQLLHVKIFCYTFGSPRVGNHAFAAEYNQVLACAAADPAACAHTRLMC
jgi:predicted lipase